MYHNARIGHDGGQHLQDGKGGVEHMCTGEVFLELLVVDMVALCLNHVAVVWHIPRADRILRIASQLHPTHTYT